MLPRFEPKVEGTFLTDTFKVNLTRLGKKGYNDRKLAGFSEQEFLVHLWANLFTINGNGDGKLLTYSQIYLLFQIDLVGSKERFLEISGTIGVTQESFTQVFQSISGKEPSERVQLNVNQRGNTFSN